MQSVAVDFAKHGECVDQKLLRKFQNQVADWPDFFEKQHAPERESSGILG